MFATPATALHLAAAAALTVAAPLPLALIGVWRGGRARGAQAAAAERQRELDDKMALIAQANAELAGRMQAMGEQLAQRQSDLARLMAERLDAVSDRVGARLTEQTRATGENLGRLNERLAVIDAAQARLTGLTEQVVGPKDILANKQTRGAFGQGRTEAIIRDALPASLYAFQPTLSNATRPDGVVLLPGDARKLAIDAKFPLEAFLAARTAKDDDARRIAPRRARAHFLRQVKDVADKYFISGETQDVALLFVPSESIFADLREHFSDVVERAHKARVLVSRRRS